MFGSQAPKATTIGEKERVEEALWFLASSAQKLGSADISLARASYMAPT